MNSKEMLRNKSLLRPLWQLDNQKEDEDGRFLNVSVPEQATNLSLVDSIIAKQMMQLSVEDREKAYMDVHGVKEGTVETDESKRVGLQTMEEEILKMEDKRAYDLALEISSKYVENPEFRLAFLRAESFDAAKAALRFVRHFELKLELFGEEKIAMDIVQDDLDREAMEALYSGMGQTTDAKDSAGRRIITVTFGSTYDTKAIVSVVVTNPSWLLLIACSPHLVTSLSSCGGHSTIQWLLLGIQMYKYMALSLSFVLSVSLL